jgi:hypothetical protein
MAAKATERSRGKLATMSGRGLLALSLAVFAGAAAIASCSTGSSTSAAGAGGLTAFANAASGPTTSSASSTTSSTGAGGSTPDSGIVCPMQYTTAKTGTCNLLNQTCPAGQTCEPQQVGSDIETACSPSPGLKQANEDCYDLTEDCDAKLLCIGASPTTPGKCVAFCCPGTNEPCNGGVCNLEVPFGSATAFMCSYGQRCQLLTANACPSGYECHIDTAAGTGVAICDEPSSANSPELGPCQYINDCASMQQCFNAPGVGNSGTCLWYCYVTGPKASQPPGLGGCEPNETCQASYQGQPIMLNGFSNVGLCFPNGGLGSDAGPGDAASD